MKKNKPTVTIGIPAYNEEANIGILLRKILLQSHDYYQLEKIIVISDGSNDNTVEVVKRIISKKIRLIDDHERKGKTNRLNEIVSEFKSEYLVVFDADVLPSNKHLIDDLIKPFLDNDNVGMVSVKRIPVKAKKFFEKIINESVEFKLRIFEKMKNGNNLYLCFGPCCAFSGNLIKKLRWPAVISDDVYSYLFCLKSGYEFIYNPHGQILYKSPDNYRDHEKQSRRFNNGIAEMSKYFNRTFVNREYNIPANLAIDSALHWIRKNPFYFICYLIILITAKLRAIGKFDADPKWVISNSSKKLN